MSRKILELTLSLLLNLNGMVLADGFHYEIDVRNQLEEDSLGRLMGLRMNWLYDREASQMLIDGEDLTPGKQAATLRLVADLMLADLHRQHYFTQLNLDGQVLAVTKVSDYRLSLQPDQRLALEFLLPLTTAQALAGRRLTIALADPSGNAVPRYQDQSHISLGAQMQKSCQVTLEQRPGFAHGEAAQIAYLQCP